MREDILFLPVQETTYRVSIEGKSYRCDVRGGDYHSMAIEPMPDSLELIGRIVQELKNNEQHWDYC